MNATSSGEIRRPKGDASNSNCSIDLPSRLESYSSRLSLSCVAVTPGQTALAVIPVPSTSLAVALVKPANACLLAGVEEKTATEKTAAKQARKPGSEVVRALRSAKAGSRR